MGRFALAMSGVFAALAAWMVVASREQQARRRVVPVAVAAAKLQAAWADHHTRA